LRNNYFTSAGKDIESGFNHNQNKVKLFEQVP
jgi:hypothetical protein